MCSKYSGYIGLIREAEWEIRKQSTKVTSGLQLSLGLGSCYENFICETYPVIRNSEGREAAEGMENLFYFFFIRTGFTTDGKVF